MTDTLTLRVTGSGVVKSHKKLPLIVWTGQSANHIAENYYERQPTDPQRPTLLEVQATLRSGSSRTTPHGNQNYITMAGIPDIRGNVCVVTWKLISNKYCHIKSSVFLTSSEKALNYVENKTKVHRKAKGVH
jgi:hypothetical protein